MRPTNPEHRPARSAARPQWSEVLRALREARGVTLDGWGARLGVSRTTVQRWERGERAPDPGAEAAILAYCRDQGLFRTYDRGPLAGTELTAELLQDLLAVARWRVSGSPVDAAPPAGRPPEPQPAEEPRSQAPPTNLPVQLTSFVGREWEIAAVRRVQAGTRLLTLTGAGGCGKTRLALRVADELLWAYPHGVWFVELAALSDPMLIPQTIASALAIQTSGSQPITDAVIEALRSRHLVLVLDNCEHLLPACAAVVETLLRACPHLAVIATSRASLGIGCETVWRVPPLAVEVPAESGGAVSHDSRLLAPDSHRVSDAVALFIERARLQRPEFSPGPAESAAVAEICRRLDGMPLAIELAAARVGVLSVGQIAARLADRFRLLTGGGRTVLPRHQTLRAAIDWSHDLLSASEQALLHTLAVFAGGFTLEAAESVCGAGDPDPDLLDHLARLVDHSLVVAEEQQGTVRYRLLETVRQYALDHLTAAGDAGVAQDLHLAWTIALAEEAESAMYGPHEADALARLEREHDNLRAALAWSQAEGERLRESALRLAGALPRFWDLRGHAAEGRRWLSRLLETGNERTTARARALAGAGSLAHSQGDFAAASTLYEECLSLYRELGDGRGVALAEVSLGRVAYSRAEYPIAVAFLKAGLARGCEQANRPVIAIAQTILGLIALRQGEYDRARAHLEASLAIQRDMGNKHGIAGNLDDLATLASEIGDDPRQAAALEECLTLYRELGHKSGIALVLGDLGIGAWLRRDYDRAAVLMQESLILYRELGEPLGTARLLGYQSLAALFARRYAEAEALGRECLALYRAADDPYGIGRYLPVLAGVYLGQGQAERAIRLFSAAAALRERLGVQLPLAMRANHDRTIAAVRTGLGDSVFETAWSAGQALTPYQAVAEALQDDGPPPAAD